MTKPPQRGSAPVPHSLQRRLLAQLQLERSAHGHGSASRLDARLGKSEGYIGRVLRGEIGLQTEQLFKMLDAFEVEPAAFFAAVVGSDFSPRRFLKKWSRTFEIESKPSVLPISKALLESFKNLLQRPASSAEEPKTKANHLYLRPFRRRRDKALCDAAQKIADAADSAAGNELEPTAKLLATAYEGYAKGRISGTTLAQVLSLAASLEHRDGSTEIAVLFLRVALEVVERPSAGELSLLVEAAELLMTDGQLVVADLFIDEAQRQAIALGDHCGMGKTLLARGSVALAKNLAYEALTAYEASLQYVPPKDWVSHVLAHHGIAQCHLALGDLFHAGRSLAIAVTRHPTRRGRLWVILQWTRANWANQRATTPEDLEIAARLYGDTLDALPQQKSLDAVVLHLQQARVWLALEASKRLRSTAAAALQLTGSLKKVRSIQELMLRFATLVMTGELTDAWLEKAIADLVHKLRTGSPAYASAWTVVALPRRFHRPISGLIDGRSCRS